MLLRYRGREGMYGWLFHRISGVAIWACQLLTSSTSISSATPTPTELLAIYASTIGRILGCSSAPPLLLPHALNGLRIVIIDFWPATRYQRALWWGGLVPSSSSGCLSRTRSAPVFGLPQFEFGGGA
jgi:succinate dehydrogenase / fumarate reductase cytochrome b subunit